MIAKLSHVIADIFIHRKLITEEQREAYEYGLELSIYSLIDIMIALAIGLISGKFWESVMFYIVFRFTKLFAGGFHASNRLIDKIIFAAALLLALIADWLLQGIENYYWFALHFYSLVIVSQFAPVENPKKELTKCEKVRFKVISIIIMAVWLAVMFLFRSLGSELDHIVALTLFCVSNLMLLDIYYGREKPQ